MPFFNDFNFIHWIFFFNKTTWHIFNKKSSVFSLLLVLYRSKAVLLLWIFYVFLSCVRYAFVHFCLYVPCGHLLRKGWPFGSRLWCITVSLSLSHWYPGSGVVLDCIDSFSLHPYLHMNDAADLYLKWHFLFLYRITEVIMPVTVQHDGVTYDVVHLDSDEQLVTTTSCV